MPRHCGGKHRAGGRPRISATKIAWILDQRPAGPREAGGTSPSAPRQARKVGADRRPRAATDAIRNASPHHALRHPSAGDWDDALLNSSAFPAIGADPCLRAGCTARPPWNCVRRTDPLASPATSRRRCSARPATARLAKNTYGTGCFMLMNTGDWPSARARPPHHRRLASAPTEFALEGSAFVTGAAVTQWLRDGLGIIKGAAEALARSVSRRRRRRWRCRRSPASAAHWLPGLVACCGPHPAAHAPIGAGRGIAVPEPRAAPRHERMYCTEAQPPGSTAARSTTC